MPSAISNTLADFPPESFTIMAFCDACGHRAPVDRAAVPDGWDVSAGDSVAATLYVLRRQAGQHSGGVHPGGRVSVG
jgi:hypothetical protein